MRRAAAGVAVLFPMLAALLFAAGCNGKPESAFGTAELAIVPGADLAGRIDYDTLWKSPVAKKTRQMRQAESTDDASPEEMRAREFEKATGLSQEDLLTVVFSGDVDLLDLDASGESTNAGSIDALCAVTLSRSISQDQLRAGMEVMVSDSPGITVSAVEIAGRPAVAAAEAVPERPALYAALSRDGRTVFISFNPDSLHGAFEREVEGRSESLLPSLTRAEKELPEGSQIRTSFLVPEPLRRRIEEKMSEVEARAGKSSGMGIMLSFVSPFRRFAGLTIGARFEESMEIVLAADLGGEGEAAQAAALIQSMALPVMKSWLARRTGAVPADFDDKMAVSNNGPMLRITMELGAEELKPMQM